MSTSQEPNTPSDLPEQPQSKWSLILGSCKRGLRAWDSGLLVITILALVGMVGYLLWPQPEMVLKVSPTTQILQPDAQAVEDPAEATSTEMLSADETASTNTENSNPSSHRSHRHAATKKKPDKPPILNLNTATLAQLQLLPGIGPKMAERVITYRKANGGFKSIEQIMDVKGIGAKKFEKMKPFLKI